MKDAVIVSAVRTAVGKAPAGTLRTTRPDDMAAATIQAALARASQFDPAEIDDVILGCAMPEAEQGMNVARIASLRAGVPVSASAVTVNRFCSSGLQAIAYAAERIMCGASTAIIAGGTETMSLVPMGGHKIAPNPSLVDSYPDVYLTTGLVAENHAREAKISRQAQDDYALRSHQRAVAAIEAGRFADEIVPLTVHLADAGRRQRRTRHPYRDLSVDEGPRRDTSPEALAKLRPAFHVAGTVTAGNSSQMSDGASALLVMEAGRAKALGLTPLARFVTYQTAGVEPERFGIGPVPAIRKALKSAGLTLDGHRPGRAQRSLCGAGAGLPGRTAHRPGQTQRQRRRHRARPSTGLHRREIDDVAALRDAAPWRRATAWCRCASAAAWGLRGYSSGSSYELRVTSYDRIAQMEFEIELAPSRLRAFAMRGCRDCLRLIGER